MSLKHYQFGGNGPQSDLFQASDFSVPSLGASKASSWVRGWLNGPLSSIDTNAPALAQLAYVP